MIKIRSKAFRILIVDPKVNSKQEIKVYTDKYIHAMTIIGIWFIIHIRPINVYLIVYSVGV